MAGIDEMFAQGSRDAQDYAVKTQSLELQRKQVQVEQQRLQATIDQHRIQTAMKVMGDWEDIYKTAPGSPLQKVRLKKMQSNMALIGLPADPEMEAAAVDDNGRSAFFKAMGNLRNLPPEQQGEVALNAWQFLGQGDAVKAIDHLNNWSDEQKKIQAQGEETRKTDVAKAALEKPFKLNEVESKNRNYVMEVRKELEGNDAYKSYANQSYVIKNLVDGLKKPGPFGDKTMLEQFIRLINPGAVVRPGTLEFINGANSAMSTFNNYIQRLARGESLQPDQRKELVDVARSMLVNSVVQYKAAAEPHLQEVENRRQSRDSADPARVLLQRDQEFFRKLETDNRQSKQAAYGKKPVDPTQAPRYSPALMGAIARAKAKGKTDSRAKIEQDLGVSIPDELANQMGLK